MKETLKNVSQAVLETGTELTVDIKPQGRLHALLQKRGVLPRQRTFTLSPLTLGTLVAVSEKLLTIDLDLAGELNLKERKTRDALYKAIVSHSKEMAAIVALAIHNRKGAPEKSLIDFIVNHFTANEMLSVLIISLSKMDIQSFYHTINLARGMNVVEQKTANATSAESAEVSL